MKRFLEQLSDEQFRYFQIVLGALAAIIGSLCILLLPGDSESYLSVGWIIAVLICGGLPTYMQRQTERPMKILNLTEIIVLVVFLGTYAVLHFVMKLV